MPPALKVLMFTDQVQSTANTTRRTLGEIQQVAHDQEVLTAEVEEAICRALVSASVYFANVWFNAGAEGQAILLALARGERPPDFRAARAWLREHDVLTDAGTYAVPMVERWVRQGGPEKFAR
jgi:hypothetical protein